MEILKNMFTPLNQNHSHNTRTATNHLVDITQIQNSDYSVNILLLLIAAVLLIRIINKQHFTTRQSSRILLIIHRSNPGVYCLYLLLLYSETIQLIELLCCVKIH